ncbi:hypothetical protein ACFQ14_00185 [Pseudahrensia aquimaris]|uniref:Uncharacterized protein n=1 Tax=Pseudahrensia aquimaris TaxID=744461 RepID=A0ABW3FEH7_9HYPH
MSGSGNRDADLKVGIREYIGPVRWQIVKTLPFIYSLIIPIVLLDLFVSLYHAVCFPAFGIAKIRRADFLVFDRHKLAYLNALEKLNCLYCAYANGVIAYAGEVASLTEKRWCPIKHDEPVKGRDDCYQEFPEYGDGQEYRERFRPDQEPSIGPKASLKDV